jgi:hypothetical protein
MIQANKQLEPEILDFLIKEGKQFNLFPVIDVNYYDSELLQASSFFVAYQNDEIAGVCSVNDLSECKQYILDDYSIGFDFIKIPLNWFLALKKLHPIPSKNEQIKLATLGFPVVLNNDPEVFKSLIDYVYYSLAGTGFHFLSLAFHEKNPLNQSIIHLPKIKYTSRLYFVNLKNDKFVPDDLNLEQKFPFIDLPRY